MSQVSRAGLVDEALDGPAEGRLALLLLAAGRVRCSSDHLRESSGLRDAWILARRAAARGTEQYNRARCPRLARRPLPDTCVAGV